MKTRIIRFPLLALVLLLSALVSARAETIYLEASVNLESNGDGVMELKTRYSASMWRWWKANFGDHPDIILRNMRYQYSKYDFSDYTLDKDDVNRSATARLKARSIATLLRDGRYAVDVAKPLRYVSHSGDEWIFNQKTSAGARAPDLDQTTRVHLPAGAWDVQVVNPDTEYQQLVYRMPARGIGQTVFLILAVVLGLAATLLFVIAQILPPGKSQAVGAAS